MNWLTTLCGRGARSNSGASVATEQDTNPPHMVAPLPGAATTRDIASLTSSDVSRSNETPEAPGLTLSAEEAFTFNSLVAVLPRATSILYRSCVDGEPESVHAAIQGLCARHPIIPIGIFTNAEISIDVETIVDQHTLLPAKGNALCKLPSTKIAEGFTNHGRGGVLLRCPFTDANGIELHELVIYWAKKKAPIVRDLILDCEQL